jgi:hypothetical protein
VTLRDGSMAGRIAGRHSWIADGEFCSTPGLRFRVTL